MSLKYGADDPFFEEVWKTTNKRGDDTFFKTFLEETYDDLRLFSWSTQFYLFSIIIQIRIYNSHRVSGIVQKHVSGGEIFVLGYVSIEPRMWATIWGRKGVW